ncbi:hypothetical protein Fmac_014946 [Flemingia macrophylla]|uniref:AAA+ ATPase domain-containing protein n=1 Tax=Flemingia macrophylla TaxID=520843 RepID=A0ABD1MD72_9FABA
MSFFSSSNVATAKTLLSTAASVVATAMVIRSVASELLPCDLHSYLAAILRRFSSQVTIIIQEFDGLTANQIYSAAETYLGTKIPPHTPRLKVTKPDGDQTLALAMERDESLTDVFNGANLTWLLVCRHVESSSSSASRSFHNPRDVTSTLKSEVRSLELTFHKKHKAMVLETYLPFILNQAKEVKHRTKAPKIFTMDYQNMYGNLNDAWVGVKLEHPATFETVAMERHVRDFVLRDLDRFLGRREYYRKVGRAWKRGYLLYGPPGTGKSSFIAAMANYLRFDVYDLELTELQCNSELRRLLISIANRSILVVEDIDCTLDFHHRTGTSTGSTSTSTYNDRQVTLSGLLNFVDGLWSSCGDERIIVFTTNHKDKLDPALLRPGRMDVHIHMPYCTPYGFRQLASNYLRIKEHYLFPQIEEAIHETQVTPAEVAEQLLKSSNIETSLDQLLHFLKMKKESQQQGKELNGGDKGEEAVKENSNDEKKSPTELTNSR